MLILILEVQSSVVYGTLSWLKEGAEPEIVFAGSSPVSYEPGVATGRFVQITLKALSDTVDAAMQSFSTARRERRKEKFPRHIDEVHYVLSSPWIVCQARTLSLDLGRPTKITPAKIESLLEAERAKLVVTAEGPTEVVEEKIFEVRLNGYSIRAWQNKEVRNLEISYSLGVAGTGALARLEQACERAASRGRVKFHSSLLLQYVGLRASMPERDTYTLIHVHGELTDVVTVSRGSCVFFGSYPAGVRSLTRAVAEATQTDEGTADSFLTLYGERHLEQAEAAQAAVSMKAIADGWIGQFRGLLAQGLQSDAALSNAVIVARTHAGFFAEAFHEAYPQARIEAKEIDIGFYAKAIHSLQKGSGLL